ncbi:hydrolase [Actinoplanes sp. SE50]|uniref:HAD family hydrolase n=1 Tax=unclassified Actinoplanes TaxID=2626549 RepID=UPI00023EC100|nr:MULTISPECIES: HAD family hydrolase [unclassified Actinoplanes]AEV85183.1 Phosphoglycolate phosphatase [Actinoplanes sp. SE50/110]ATO83578.1 hydrolase [Actinoplanes sp. SE50]SLM00985.1 hydrolase [Actinoplanes sp. SE50/110]
MIIPVWDMDGTLIDSTEAVPRAFVQAVAVLGGPPVTPADVVGSYWRGTNEVILTHLVGRPLSPAEQEIYFRQLDDVSVPVYPGILDTLCALHAAGLPLVVFTGASTRAATLLLHAAGITCDLLIGGDQIRAPKPAPDGMLLAADRLGVTPDRLIMVGDSPLDLGSATAAGSRSAAAAWGHMHDPAAPADHTLAAPGDLLPIIGCR